MRRYQVDFPHAVHVARLSLQLYNPLMALLDCPLDNLWRECLETAALLHDAGYFVNQKGHHRHSRYLIRHAEETQYWEPSTRECIAELAYYHRKALPAKKLRELSKNPTWMALAAILRIADGLDRCHCQKVTVQHIKISSHTVELIVTGLQREPWDHVLRIKSQGFQEAFHRQFLIRDPTLTNFPLRV